jgi:hypothetical protein
MSPLALDAMDRLRDMLALPEEPAKAKRRLIPFINK